MRSPEAPCEDYPESAGFELCSEESLGRWTERVTAELRQAVDTVCGPGSRLSRLIMALVNREPSQVHRLLSLMVLAALTGDPEPALPVCLVSRLWWAGVDALDDLVDGQADGDPSLSPQQVMVAATACIALSQAVPGLWPVPGQVRRDWEREITRANAAAAEGQLAGQLAEPEEASWARAMASYRDKNGAAYARDALMAARLATDDPAALRGWRAFGSVFGVMRQLRNDGQVASPADDEDLANGVFTLELAHALENAAPDRRESLRELRARARHDTAARARLRRALAEPDLAQPYGTKIQPSASPAPAPRPRQVAALRELMGHPSPPVHPHPGRPADHPRQGQLAEQRDAQDPRRPRLLLPARGRRAVPLRQHLRDLRQTTSPAPNSATPSTTSSPTSSTCKPTPKPAAGPATPPATPASPKPSPVTFSDLGLDVLARSRVTLAADSTDPQEVTPASDFQALSA